MPGKSFDCIVAGAGTAGCVLAKKLAEAGLSVCILDRKSKNDIGWPWEVAVEKRVFSRIGLLLPPENKWLENPEITRFYASRSTNYVEVNTAHQDVFSIQHKKLNKILFKQALKAGVIFRENHYIEELLLNDSFACGVKGRRKGILKKIGFSIRAPVIIDASGISAILRRQTPESFNIKHTLRAQDYAFGWQQLHAINNNQIKALEKEFNLKPGIAYTRLGKYHAYEVIHLRKDHTACLIFGGSIMDLESSAKNLCQKFIEKYPYFGPVKYSGGRPIPIRRAIDSMVGNGFICIGDSACQVIPTMGSGVASSIHAADVASRAIVGAFNKNDFSTAGLWSYNLKYQSKRGAILAGYDIIRRFVQSLTDEEIERVFKAGLIQNENFVDTFSSNTIKYDIVDILENLGKIFSNIEVLPVGLRFIQAFRDSQKALQIYKRYPQDFVQKDFLAWQKQTDELFSHYRTFSDKKEETFI
jgi:flavin-dependent dehydrogenase